MTSTFDRGHAVGPDAAHGDRVRAQRPRGHRPAGRPRHRHRRLPGNAAPRQPPSTVRPRRLPHPDRRRTLPQVRPAAAALGGRGRVGGGRGVGVEEEKEGGGGRAGRQGACRRLIIGN